MNWLRSIFQGNPKVEPTPQRQISEPRSRPPAPPLPPSQEEFRRVDPAHCKGDPPAKAFCRESPLEFDLEWNDQELRIRYLGEVLRAESFRGNGHPRKTSLQRVAEGDSIPAGALRAMVLGMTRLRLEAKGAAYLCNLCMTHSAGHGSIETWVRLVLDTQAKTARYESFSEFDDCR